MIDECWERSLDLLHQAATPHGFVASTSFRHYASIWARDAAIASLGAVASGESSLVDAVRRTVAVLAERQGRWGQIPDAVWPDRGYWDWGEGGATDASAWFVVMAGLYIEASSDRRFAVDIWPSVKQALDWLRRQDSTNTGIIDSPPSGDWMDSSLVRSGRVLHVNVVYLWAARSGAALADVVGADPLVDPGDLARRINLLFWPSPDTSLRELFSHVGHPGPGYYDHEASVRAFEAESGPRSHYLAHVAHGAFVDRCDVLANVLAVLTGLAGTERAPSIVSYLSKSGVADPYPSRTWPEPVDQDDPWAMWNRGAERTMNPRWRNPPWSYHNAGIWPYVGALHAAAVADGGDRGVAMAMLERVAAANALESGEWGFHEWLDGRSGKPGGARDQTWNAGAFVFALDRVRRMSGSRGS